MKNAADNEEDLHFCSGNDDDDTSRSNNDDNDAQPEQVQPPPSPTTTTTRRDEISEGIHKSSKRERINFLNDPIEEMTYGRRIALYLIKQYPQYYLAGAPYLSQQDELDAMSSSSSEDEEEDESYVTKNNKIYVNRGLPPLHAPPAQSLSSSSMGSAILPRRTHHGSVKEDRKTTDDGADDGNVVELYDVDDRDHPTFDHHRHDATRRRVTFVEDDDDEADAQTQDAMNILSSERLVAIRKAEGIEKALYNEAFSYPFANTSTTKDPPSLEKAWAYFEHYTLARYKVKDGTSSQQLGLANLSSSSRRMVHQLFDLFSKGRVQLDRAQPGEDTVPTRLYDPIWTPQKQLGDFGIGIGLLFSNERAIGLLCLMATLLNIPYYIYYSSDDYNGGNSTTKNDNTNWLLSGSAICSNYSYVPCLNCSFDDQGLGPTRVARAKDAITGIVTDSFIFAIKNNCIIDDEERPRYINIATMSLFIIGMIIMYWYTVYQAKAFDENIETAQDYSIQIHNPPEDAKDPEEWRAFFEGLRSELGLDDLQVKACTIGVSNDKLVRDLVQRREKLLMFSMQVDPGIKLEPATLESLAKLEMKKRRRNPSL